MSSTSHRAASATSENTPLIVDHDDNARDASEHEDFDRDHDESVPNETLSPTSRNFFIALLFATLLLSLAFASLSIAAFFMLRFGESRFGASDYYIDGALVTGLTVLGLAGAGHGVYNIVRLFKFQLAKLPSLRILAIASACLSLVAAFSLAPYYLDLDGWYCSRDRLNEPWYPGTWEECKRWESAYMAVCFTMVVTLGLNAIFSIVFVFTAFSIARTRSTEPNPNWTISPGYFSFEIKLRWGTERAGHERQQHPPRGNGINDERTEPVPVGTESA